MFIDDAIFRQEIRSVRKMGLLTTVLELFNLTVNGLCILVTLLAYTLLGHEWTVTRILYLIAWGDVLKQVISGDFIFGFYFGAEAYWSCRRAQVSRYFL